MFLRLIPIISLVVLSSTSPLNETFSEIGDDILSDLDPEIFEGKSLIDVGRHYFKRKPFSDNKEYFANPNDTSYSYDPDSPRAPNLWYKTFPQCKGLRQSPVNLNPKACNFGVQKYHLSILRQSNVPVAVTLENNGHSIEFNFEYDNGRPLLVGGPLNGSYIFEQLHFHWDLVRGSGSEHALNSKTFDLEMHLVHKNSKYRTIAEATQHRDGIAVLGILFQESRFAEDSPLFEFLPEVREYHTEWEVDDVSRGFRMKDIVGSLKETIVGYQGSLTTPPCSEAVSWFVRLRARKISSRDMRNFRRILREDGEFLAPNYRPLQKINNRRCYLY